MKRFALTILAALIAVQISHAGWWKTYGVEGYDVGNCVQIASDGNYIIAGNKADSMWLLKVDTLGYEIWSKTYKSSEYESYANWLEETSDGGFIVCGSPDLMKVTSEGDSMWAQDYGIDAQCVQIVDGGYAVAGYSWYYGDSSFVIRTDGNGNPLWTQVYKVPGHHYNHINFIQTTSDDGYIITGHTEYQTEMLGYSYLWLIKTDSLGDTLWTKWYGFGNDDDYSYGHCVKEIEDGYIVTGQADAGLGLWLLKTDETGDTLWSKIYVGIGFSVQQTQDSGYIVVGTTAGTFASQASPGAQLWLLKTDSLGDTTWTRLYGNDDNNTDWGTCIDQCSDKGYIITGQYDDDMYLLRTDSLGLLSITEDPTSKSIKKCLVLNQVGSEISLSYENFPQGFQASVFDVSGREVDQIRSQVASGIITWGIGFSPGVYFIRASEGKQAFSTTKVVLIK